MPTARWTGRAGWNSGNVIGIDQHDHEEHQDHDRTGVDDHLDHRQELGAEHHEDASDIEEADHQEDGRVNGIARRHHAAGASMQTAAIR